MKRGQSALDVLISGLCGREVAFADWPEVIALANHTLLTPALAACLAGTGQLERLPQDVEQYLRFIHGCNRQRNLRLRTQLIEAADALNQHDVIPILLKGAVPLFLCSSASVPDRIMSDLDLAVEPAEAEVARDCLAKLGYTEARFARGMARAQDVGILELRPYRSPDRIPPKIVRRRGMLVRIPDVESRALHWMMHDLIKEGDYWRGRMDFRHLHDLALLAQQHELDWAAMRASLSDQTARNAFDTQLLALRDFFGVSVPQQFLQRHVVRLQHWRRVSAIYHPRIRVPLRLLGNTIWGLSRLNHKTVRRRYPAELVRGIARILLDADRRSKL